MSTLIISFMLLTNCDNNNENLNPEYDQELIIAKKALTLIADNNQDSLFQLFSPKLREMVTKEQINYIMTEGKRLISNNIYPNDSLITISQSVNFSIGGKTVFKELSMPFVHPYNDDSTKYFKITFSELEIQKLYINTGMRFQILN